MRPRSILLKPPRHDDWGAPDTQVIEAAPEIVCLCGSTKFKDEYRDENRRLTCEGKVVLSVGFFGHADGWGGALDDGTKEILDDLHKRKIDLADRVHVINVGGYVGESTESEIRYAMLSGKQITWYEPGEVPEWVAVWADREAVK